MIPDKLSEPSSDDGALPRRLGSYVLVCRLGEGGMGRVYLALSREQGRVRPCVVKRFGNPRSDFTPEQIEENRLRFRREAAISMALSHPCIARTHHCVDQGDEFYLVEEFVDGMTLEHLGSSMAERDEHFSLPLAAYIAGELARALDYLHEFRGVGLIHRDLSPSNVMFSKRGQVKIIDFGIAKATFAADIVSRPHVLIGKPTWTAPEVIAGQAADRRADLYALGLLFWSMLSRRFPDGQRAGWCPWPGPSTFNLDVPPALDSIVLTAIHRDPGNRFQTAREFFEAVAPFSASPEHGQGVLAHLVSCFRPSQDERAFADAVRRGRRLILATDRPRSALCSPGRRRLALALLVALPMLAAGVGASRKSKSALPPAPVVHAPAEGQKETAVGEGSAPAAKATSSPAPTASPPAASTPAPAPSPRAVARRRRSVQKAPTVPSAGTSLLSATAMLDEAVEAISQGDTVSALALARASAKAHASPAAFVMVGRLLFESDPAEARAALESALELSPADQEAEKLLAALARRTR